MMLPIMKGLTILLALPSNAAWSLQRGKALLFRKKHKEGKTTVGDVVVAKSLLVGQIESFPSDVSSVATNSSSGGSSSMSNCALDIDSIDDPDWLKARALMEKRSLKDCEEAAAIYEQCIARYSKISGIGGVDPQLFLEAAQSRNAVMRIKTHSNTLHITKMLDTPENKEVWKIHGPRAMELASLAKEGLSSTHPEAMVCYADAYFFANSVKGLLSAAVTGSGLTFKANSKELIQNCEHAEAGIGHAYLGAFFLMAPWPIYNARAAEKHLMAAYNIAPCRRNAYYVGVMYYRLGNKAKAAKYFREAISAKPLTPSEGDFTEWVEREATLALDACA